MAMNVIGMPLFVLVPRLVIELQYQERIQLEPVLEVDLVLLLVDVQHYKQG